MNLLRPRLQANAIVLGLLLALGICLRSPPCLAEEYKIGVINTDRIMRESAPAKDAARKIEQEFKEREASIVKLDRELRDLASRFDRDTISESERAARQRDIESRGRELERVRRQIGEDLKTRQFDEMNRIKERLDTVLTKIAKEQGYDLILQDGLFVRPSVDITDVVIKALATP